MMKKLIVTVAISGAGKTTWLNKQLPKEQIVSPDDVRREMTGDVSNQLSNIDVWNKVYSTINHKLQQYDIVALDATNVSSQTRDTLLLHIPNDVYTVAVVFPMNVELSKKRIKNDIDSGKDRANVPDEVVDRQLQQFNDGKSDLKKQFKKVIYLNSSNNINLESKILKENQTNELRLVAHIRNLIKDSKFFNHTYVAGGFARDMVMGKSSKDIDLVVDLPNGGIDIAIFLTKADGSYRENSNPVLYPRFGTSKFNLRNSEFADIDLEAVMTRGEVYTQDSRKPDVSYADLKQDASRRDLTINSLYYDVSNKKILDPSGTGISDIRNKVLRTPLDPNQTFMDDPLRMMRLVRFSCKYGWELPDDMKKALIKNASKLESISKERIQDELNKILLSDNVKDGLLLLLSTRLMKYIIPELYNLKNLTNSYHQWDALEHTLNVVANSVPRIEIRMSALLHDIGKYKTHSVGSDGNSHFKAHEDASFHLAKDILSRLKYPNSFIQKIQTLVQNHMRTKSYGNDAEIVGKKALRKLMMDMGDDLEDLLLLVHADNISHGSTGWKYNMEHQVDAIKDKLLQLGDFAEKMKLPISGNEIMKWLNIKQGKDIGIILDKFKDIFLDDPEKINLMSENEIKQIIFDIYNDIKIKNESVLKLKNLISL